MEGFCLLSRPGGRSGGRQAQRERDDGEGALQEQVLYGPPPLGPGAAPLDRLIAYGRARIGFLTGHRETARAAQRGGGTGREVAAASAGISSAPA
ncbi:hypothetical protein ACH492_03695 [Streptomyces sp. NPDC019443]|uniref:hypothetical protein n=1 Tax=Streptomyces sp. NPDC019443 TaxID=3365061 RepID=UPI0037937A87